MTDEGNKQGVVARAMMILIQWYRRYISPLLPDSCIYSPTCSEYALEAIKKYGAAKGGWLAFCRILRCNPFCRGGHDTVP